MIDTCKKYPFWRTRPEDVAEALRAAKLGEVHHLTKSAGGRDIYYITYGEREDYNRRANYSSACGAHDERCYADREGKRPTLMLIGATHGQELEGVCGIMNLISLIETGRDLRGLEVPMVTEAYKKSNCRLVIVPIYNMDGRCRCVPDSMLEETPDGLRYHGQGTWKDGTLCGWPGCKAVHPIKEASDHLGSYFNDDGVNLMHDNFFAPMARETAAMLKLVDEEAPECVVGLHGGSNSTNMLLQPDYVTLDSKQGVFNLATGIAAHQEALGLKSYVVNVSEKLPGTPAPSFNLTSAIHHISGAVSSTYESNEGLIDRNQFNAEDILLHHYCLFAAMFEGAYKTR